MSQYGSYGYALNNARARAPVQRVGVGPVLVPSPRRARSHARPGRRGAAREGSEPAHATARLWRPACGSTPSSAWQHLRDAEVSPCNWLATLGRSGNRDSPSCELHKLLVAGEWLETGEWSEVRSPYDDTVVGPGADRRRGSGSAGRCWRRRKPSRRSSPATSVPLCSNRASHIVRERVDDLHPGGDRRRGGQAAEDGEGGGNAMRRDPDVLAVEARKFSGETVPMDASETGAGTGVILRVPYGVVGAISPFNFPLNPRRPQARPRRWPWQPREAGRADADLGPAPGRDPRRRRAPRWVAQRDLRSRKEVGNAIVDDQVRAVTFTGFGRGRLGHSGSRPAQEGQPRARLKRTTDRRRAATGKPPPRDKASCTPSHTPGRLHPRSSASSCTRPSPTNSRSASSPTSRASSSATRWTPRPMSGR